MARPVWKGHISFGLINIPVTLYSAEQRCDLHFRMLDSRNMAKVRYERVNEETGEEVPWNEIVKGFEYDDGSYVILHDDDFKQVAVEATQTVDLEGFVDAKAIDYVYFDKPYYLVPGKKAEKGYVLLRETLRRTHKIGIAKVVIRARQYLAALLAEGDALVLNLLRYHQELRSLEEYKLPGRELKDYKVTAREIDMAAQLVDAMTIDWDPQQYHDEYRDALMQWIEKKARAGKKGVAVEKESAEASESGGAEIIDMMELLQKSMQQGKAKGGAKPRSKTQAKRKPARKASPSKRKSGIG
jgi:DNA end-binding protein Ku